MRFLLQIVNWVLFMRLNIVRRVKLLALFAATPVLVGSGSAWAAQLYGTAVVQQGTMTIVRGAEQLQYAASAAEVTVQEQDLIRVRDASRVVLKTRERSTLTLGSNAILHCLPWTTPQSKGVLRLLFGRFQAKVETLSGQEFNVRTSTATIGVKGTSYSLAETSNGNTAVLGIEHVVTATGLDGVAQPVSPGQVSTVVGNAGATASVPAPEAFQVEMAKIDAPPPDSQAAINLPAEQVLVDQGIVSKEALDK